MLFTFFYKQATLMRRSTVLSLPFQLVSSGRGGGVKLGEGIGAIGVQPNVIRPIDFRPSDAVSSSSAGSLSLSSFLRFIQFFSIQAWVFWPRASTRNTKGGSITVLLTSCLTGINKSVLQIKTKIVSSNTAVSIPVNQEVNGTVVLPPLIFPGLYYKLLADVINI